MRQLKNYLVIFKYALSCFLIILTIPEISHGSGDAVSLRERLLQNYDPKVPPKFANWSIDVYLKVYTIENLVEKNGQLVCGVAISWFWEDKRLAWNQTVEQLTRINVNESAIWQPTSLFVLNRIADPNALEQKLSFVYANGHVMRFSSMRLSTICTFDLRQFPFDKQECHIILGTIKGENGHPISTENYIVFYDRYRSVAVTSRWERREQSSYRAVTPRFQPFFGEQIQSLDFPLYFQRRCPLLSTSIMCPLLMNVVVSLLPFWLNSEMRIVLSGVTLLLGNAIFWKFNELVPLDGDSQPVLAQYCMLTVSMSLFILLYCVLSFKLQRRQMPVSFLISFASRVTKHLPPILLCLPSKVPYATVSAEEDQGLASFPNPENSLISWEETVEVLDKLAFALCTSIDFLATIVMLIIISG